MFNEVFYLGTDTQVYICVMLFILELLYIGLACRYICRLIGLSYNVCTRLNGMPWGTMCVCSLAKLESTNASSCLDCAVGTLFSRLHIPGFQ